MVLAKQLLFQLQLSDLLYSGLISLCKLKFCSIIVYTCLILHLHLKSPFSQLLAATEPQRLTSTAPLTPGKDRSLL